MDAAWIGLIGVAVGSVLTTVKDFSTAWYANRKQRALDKGRTKLLRQMLDARDWRKLSTLSRVIGADADTTRQLLIELGARGSEKLSEADEEVWGLISKHPLERIE
jgi:hypothetical protein